MTTSLYMRLWNWCCRFRHQGGYGVHSPSDFFLITSVIYEKMPYYVFHDLHYLREDMERWPHYREKTDQLLFRMVNYWQPASMLEVGTGSGLQTRYMAEAKRVRMITIDEGNPQTEIVRFLSACPWVECRYGDILATVGKFLREEPFPEWIHIGHTPYYKEVYEMLLPHVTDRTCIVVSFPYAMRSKKKWWKSVMTDPRTGVIFDLYDVGIIFFDKKRVKECRVVNFF